MPHRPAAYQPIDLPQLKLSTVTVTASSPSPSPEDRAWKQEQRAAVADCWEQLEHPDELVELLQILNPDERELLGELLAGDEGEWL